MGTQVILSMGKDLRGLQEECRLYKYIVLEVISILFWRDPLFPLSFPGAELVVEM